MEDEPASEILDATYHALCEHGYADLTLRDIAAEADTSKASIHYHYDRKEQLFAAFLDSLYERYAEQVTMAAGDTPRERLYSLFETLLGDDADGPHREFRTVMLELKAQSPYDEAIRAKLVEFDALLYERLREIVAAAVDAGEFHESVDPAVAAELLTAAVTGAHTRQVAVDRSFDLVHESIENYVGDALETGRPAEVTS